MYQTIKTKLLALFLSVLMASTPSIVFAQEEGKVTNL